MASENLKALTDQLGTMNEQERQQLRAAGTAVTSAPSPNALRFPNDARVIDVATGLRAIVTRGDRDPVLNTGRYAVRLADGRLVFRGDAELEADPSPAPVK